MTTSLRLLAGGTALAVGLCFLSVVDAAPVLPKDTSKKLVEADIAQLQKHLAVIEETKGEDPIQARRYARTARTLAMMLALEGEATGDAALRGQALKVAAAIVKLDDEVKKKNAAGILSATKAAAAEAKSLAFKSGAAPLKPSGLEKTNNFSLDDVMSPFHNGKVGGLNIEKDIKDAIKKDSPVKLTPEAVEILAARTAILGDYMAYFPNDKAETNQANKDMWKTWSKNTTDTSKQLAEEAAKGKGASDKEISSLLSKLNARCSDCHNKFRDD